MLRQARLFFASIVAVATAVTAVACVQAPSPAESDEENVGTAEEAVISSGYERTYYADDTFSQTVGIEVYDCDPDYRFMEGEETRYWKQRRYDCPGYDNPLLPSCELCTTYTTSQGQTVTSCTGSTCPVVNW